MNPTDMPLNPNNITPNRRHRGAILILTMVIVFTLAIVVLSLCRTMQVESLASANHAALLQATSIERGAEQYVLAMLATEGAAVLDLDESYFAGVQVGEGYFWILRPQYEDTDLPVFGLVDENSKLDINDIGNDSTRYDALMNLPGMTEDIAAAIIDWRDSNDTAENSGAESDYYLSLPDPYYAKNDRFETVEELLMVRNMTREYLFGDGSAGPLGVEQSNVSFSRSGSLFSDPQIARGLFDLLTVYSRSSNAQQGANPLVRGRVNVNTAPRAVLLCVPNLSEADVDTLLTARQSQTLGTTNMGWAASALGTSTQQLADRLTGESLRYSADILAVSGNGRAFKRVRIVIDRSSSTVPPVIIYRRDLTDRGWPMDAEILTAIRSGQAADVLGTTNTFGGSRS